MRIEHTLPSGMLENRRVQVLVVGAGGTGSAVVMGLPFLDQAIRAWGQGRGLDVWLMDADTVTATNCVRQPFSLSDVGLNKATILINRINLFWETNWNAVPMHLSKRVRVDRDIHPDIVIGCVDSRAGRAAIEEALRTTFNRTTYWLDLGNNAASGQYILGQPLNSRNHRKAERLRTVAELYPEIADVGIGEDPLPSCSAVEALSRQEPFINQTLATSALAMLARLFRYQKLLHHGAFFNAATGHMSALPVDPQLWKRIRQRSQRASTRKR